MSQFNAPVRRAGGQLDVYTGVLAAAVLALLAGVILLGARNISHSRTASQPGGVLKLVQ
jgi:hypothetical protein